MTALDDSRSLWEFALALYSSPGVEETSLALQDQAGANINVVLWACWLEVRAVPLTPDLLLRAENAIAEWDGEVVQALRSLRRRLACEKPEEGDEDAGLIRALLKDAELLAERRCLGLLSAIEVPPSRERPAGGANLDFYLNQFQTAIDHRPIRDGLTKLLKSPY